MLRHVSNGLYLEAIRMAERTVLHVEVLFATIDDLEWQFAWLGIKGMLPSFGDPCLIGYFRNVTRQRISYALQKAG